MLLAFKMILHCIDTFLENPDHQDEDSLSCGGVTSHFSHGSGLRMYVVQFSVCVCRGGWFLVSRVILNINLHDAQCRKHLQGRKWQYMK